MTETIIRASDFENSIGIAAHLESENVGSQPGLVAVELSYLGITNLRVPAPYSNLATYIALGQAGIKFDVITSSSDLSQQMSLLDSIAPYVSSVEGPNEVNTVSFTYAGLAGPAAAEAFQADLYSAVKNDPALAGVAVLPFSLSVGASEAGYGDVFFFYD